MCVSIQYFSDFTLYNSISVFLILVCVGHPDSQHKFLVKGRNGLAGPHVHSFNKISTVLKTDMVLGTEYTIVNENIQRIQRKTGIKQSLK